MQPCGEGDESGKRWIALAALNRANIRTMQSGDLGESLLSKTRTAPEIGNLAAESRKSCSPVGKHAAERSTKMTKSLQTMSSKVLNWCMDGGIGKLL